MSKICSQCFKLQSLDNYYIDRSKPDLHRPNCKCCESRRSRWGHLRYRYNMTSDDYNVMLVTQGNRCGVCERVTKLVVDHCHKTNKVRGLLCATCNSALGMVHEDFSRLLQLGAYLKKHSWDACK